MNEQLTQIQAQFQASFRELLTTTTEMAPKVVVGVLAIVLAIVVARVVRSVLRSVLTRTGLDNLLLKGGITPIFERLGISEPPSRWIPLGVYYLLLFLFARTGADALGLTAVSGAIGSFLAYVPKLVAAVVLMLLGSVAGRLAGRAVANAAASSGIDYGGSLGGVVHGLLLFITGVMALGQLSIETDIIRIVTICMLSAIALAFGLSIGLGTRQITTNILAGFYARKVFRVGEELEIKGERGTLVAITPTQTLLSQGQKTVAISNSVFLEEIARQ